MKLTDNFNFQTTHISALPMEIILYVLRWVVSSDLDLRSLEMCSRVCRGFYLCSRDPEIWRLACARYVLSIHPNLAFIYVMLSVASIFNHFELIFMNRIPPPPYQGMFMLFSMCKRNHKNGSARRPMNGDESRHIIN